MCNKEVHLFFDKNLSFIKMHGATMKKKILSLSASQPIVGLYLQPFSGL
jgi:hypothetical protein